MHGIGRPAESEHHAEGPATRCYQVVDVQVQAQRSEQQYRREHGNGKEIKEISGMP